MRRLEGRLLKVYALLFLVCLPFALPHPSRRLPGMVPILALEHILFHPSLWFSAVSADTGALEDWQPESREKRALLNLERGLQQEANPQASEPLKVRRAYGMGGGGWPDHLLLERGWSDEDSVWLEGCPVVRGQDLVGFVHVPRGRRERSELQKRGLLQVQLLNHRAPGSKIRRFAGMARSLHPKARKSDRPIRLVLGASHPKDPFPLHSLRSSPEQADTRSRGPFLVQLMESRELHPSLPDGLVLGWIRDEVYAREGCVLSRWVLPRWHPASLVQVELLGGHDKSPARGSAGTQARHPWPAPKRSKARVVWRSPGGLGYRRYLIQGNGLRAGMAILDGAYCLGRIEWAQGGIALAVPLSRRGSVLPMLWWRGPDRKVEALVLEGLGSNRQADRFRLLHPTVLDRGFLDQGLLFSGTMGSDYPAGLLITGLFRRRGRILELEDASLLDWPDMIEVSHTEGPSR